MHKSLAIFGVMLGTVCPFVFAVENPPKTGTAQSDGRSKQQPTSQTGLGSPAAATATPGTEQIKTPNRTDENAASKDDIETQRRLAEYTKWLVVVTAGLVIVGAGQVYLLVRQERILNSTRNEIHSQVGWMKIQTEHMNSQAEVMGRQAAEMQLQRELLGSSVAIARDSAQAAQQSADAALSQIQMTKDKERARLVVKHPTEFPRPTNFAVEDEHGIELLPLELIVEVINEGATKAFNVKMSGYVTIEQIEPMVVPSFLGSDLTLPKVVGAFDAEHPLRVAIASPELVNFTMISSEDWRSIANGQKMPRIIALCAKMSETSRPSTITVGRGKKSHFDEHKQDTYFFRFVGSFGA
jgi:hypothetical protein